MIALALPLHFVLGGAEGRWNNTFEPVIPRARLGHHRAAHVTWMAKVSLTFWMGLRRARCMIACSIWLILSAAKVMTSVR